MYQGIRPALKYIVIIMNLYQMRRPHMSFFVNR